MSNDLHQTISDLAEAGQPFAVVVVLSDSGSTPRKAGAKAVVDAGGTIEDQGEFVPGEPYLFARDLDGYLFEIWFELKTPIDPD